MDTFSVIRNFYAPQQPDSGSNDAVGYEEHPPAKLLQHAVFCYWELYSEKPLAEDYLYRVVADGCTDVYFNRINPAESYTMGFCRRFVQFNLGRKFRYFGIRFLPSFFSQMFRINARQLHNSEVELRHILPDFATFISGIPPELHSDKVINSLDDFLTKKLQNIDFVEDQRFYNALAMILNSGGNIKIGDIDTGLSERQLRRYFEYYIGASPKIFSQVVRLQTMLRQQLSSSGLQRRKIFFDESYHDQAHFIKEFKTFYGITPGEAFAK